MAEESDQERTEAPSPQRLEKAREEGQVPQSRHVRGSNMVFLGVVADRVPGRAILISTLDNLVKGASGQAVQNMNLVMGFPETLGLEQIALMP